MRHMTPLLYIDAVARTGSIRRAAETLNITSTALNRRILAMEEELGVALFERLPRGVRLSTAGELMIHHIRAQAADLERVKSQIADLSGVRRGHVAIACSQAFLPFFLPEMIARYRREHPGVTFSVQRRDRAQAEQALIDHEVDLALIFEPVRLAEFQPLARVRQPVHAIMGEDHPLAATPDADADAPLRLRDCVQHPLALPELEYGIRHLLEIAARARGLELRASVESDSFEFLRMHAAAENILTFQIPVGLPHASQWPGAAVREMDARDVPPGIVALGQLKGRALPVAASRFAQQMTLVFEERFDCE